MNVLIYLILTALLGGGVSGGIERGMKARLNDSLRPRKVRVQVHRGSWLPLSRTVNAIEVELEDFRLREGPGEGVVFNPGRDVLAGKVNKIDVVARRFEVQELAVRELQVSVRKLRYNLRKAVWRRQLEVTGIRSCRGQITLEEVALNRFIAPRVKELKDFRLRFVPGRVEISGKVNTPMRLGVPITLSARVEPRLGQLYLLDPKLKVTVVPVPGFVTRRIIDQINPVVDLNQDPNFPCIVQITDVNIGPAALQAKATIVFRATPPASKSDRNARPGGA